MSWSTWCVFLSYPLWETLLHAALARFAFTKDTPHQKQAVIAILVGLVLLVVATVVFEGPKISMSTVFLSLIWSTCLSHVYFHAYNMSETARRIRLILNLRDKLPIAPATSQSSEAVVGRRIDRLLALHQLSLQNERYVGKRSFLMYVAVFLRSYERFIFPERQ